LQVAFFLTGRLAPAGRGVGGRELKKILPNPKNRATNWSGTTQKIRSSKKINLKKMGNNPKEEDVYEAVDHCDQREAPGSVEHKSYDETYKEGVEYFSHVPVP